LDSSYSPYNLQGFDKAVSLLTHIREHKEKILIHGDYDVDGIAGTALMYKGLKNLDFEVDWFLPNRFRDGYGMTVENIKKFHKEEVKWIITVDTGISALEEIRLANELGMKVIVTDHHQVPETLPPAQVILNSNQPDCAYPNKDLCGTGIAYLLINELFLKLSNRSAEEFLDLVALASLADVAPMSEGNRLLVRKGLKTLEQTQNQGLQEMLKKLGLVNTGLSTTDVLFKIVPYLNAPGRMGNPESSLKLLIAEDKKAVGPLLDQIWKSNTRRKILDRDIVLDAVNMIERNNRLENTYCFVMASSQWHEGVIGIVAAKIVDKYYKPAFIISVSDGIAKASGRTVEGFNLHQALTSVQDLLEKWGGHYHACGFSMKETNIAEFQLRMNKLAEESLKDSDQTRIISPVVEVNLEDINSETMLWLKRFEPFGPLNEVPLFYTEDAFLDGEPRIVGGEHLKFCITNGIIRFDAIAFGLGYLEAELKKDHRLNLAFYPEWNYFADKKSLQLRVIALEQVN
jgi:single-stranded-DNA-specific exonuclease